MEPSLARTTSLPRAQPDALRSVGCSVSFGRRLRELGPRP
jgi:hypothetical protein